MSEQGIQRQLAVPPSSYLERNNGCQNQLVVVIPVLVVIHRPQAFGIKIHHLHKIIGLIIVTHLKDILTLEDVCQRSTVIGIRFQVNISHRLLVTVEVAHRSAQRPIIGVSLIRTERKLKDMRRRRHVTQLHRGINRPLFVIFHLVILHRCGCRCYRCSFRAGCNAACSGR